MLLFDSITRIFTKHIRTIFFLNNSNLLEMKLKTKTVTYLLGFILLFAVNPFSVTATTVIQGVVQNTGEIEYSPKKYLKVELYTPHLSSQILFKDIVIENGSFQIDLEITEAQVIAFHYLRQKVYLYVQPFDTLQVSCDADKFPESLSFSGKAAINNKIFAAFSEKFPEEKNQMKIMQYRKGTIYYKVGVDLDSDMRRKSPEDFKQQMDNQRDAKFKAYELYKEQFGVPSEDFEQYIWADISYDWAYNLLMYGHAHGFYNKVTPEFFFFIHEVPLMNTKAMGSPKYRNYITAYVNYVCMEKFPEEDAYFKQFELAKSEGLKDEALAYVESTIVVGALKKHENRDAVIPFYQEYLNGNHHEKYNKIVMDTYQEVNRYAAGQMAQNFTLKNTAGELVSLSDFKGKTVYIDFWASWCRPCVKKLQDLQAIQNKLANDENVVFIHISFDANYDEWMQKINENGFTGIHLNAPESTKSQVAQLYDIKALPEYFIITDQGTFAQKPIRFDLVEVQDKLEMLSKKVTAAQKF